MHDPAMTTDARITQETQPNKCDIFQGNAAAKGIAFNAIGRAGIIASHIYISTAFIFLAAQSAGCITDGKVDKSCDAKVYGMRPSSLVATISTVSGLLAAFFMPVIGSITDYTPHRKSVGMVSGILIVLIQFAQIWTNSATWFIMIILQAINGFVYQVQFLATFSYFPDIGDAVGEQTMNNFIAKFRMIQFGSTIIYLILFTAVSKAIKTSDVVLSMYSQILSVIWIGVCFTVGWMTLPDVPQKRFLSSDQSLLTAGFIQTWKTTKRIVFLHYGKSLRSYFLAVIFSEAGATSFSALAVVFMSVVLEMTGGEIGIEFLVVLFSSIPGSKLGELITNRTNPQISLRLCLAFFSSATVAGSLVLSGPDKKNIVHVFGILWGISLGWYYPAVELMFSMICPEGQEAELTGFYVYSTIILSWLPPLIFTTMYENGVSMQWGLMSLALFLVIGIGFLFLMDPWDTLREARTKDPEVEIPSNDKLDTNATRAEVEGELGRDN